MFCALAKRLELTPADAGRIASATTTLSSSSVQAEVLLLLVGRAPGETIGKAAASISSNSARRRVLAALD